MITEEIRAKFRARERGRYRIDLSHWQNGVLYSTDGRILLCEPTPEGVPAEGDWPSPAGVLQAAGFPEALGRGPWASTRLPGPVDEPWQPHRASLIVRATPWWWLESVVSWTINQLPGLAWQVAENNGLHVLRFKAAGGAYGFTHCIEPYKSARESDFWHPEAARG